MKTLIEKGLFLAALAFFVLFVIVSWIVTANAFELPKPAAWLEAWVKMFQTLVTIVVGLKIAWNFPELLQLLGKKATRQDPPHAG